MFAVAMTLAALAPAAAHPAAELGAMKDQRLRQVILHETGRLAAREVPPEFERAFGTGIAALFATDRTISVRPRAPDEAAENLSILVDIGARKLRFYSGDLVAEFPVTTARPGIQKYGTFRVTLKRENPTWIPTPNQRKLYRNLPGSVPPGPDNPLGVRALNLSAPNLRIHGTNRPDLIGEAVSDGCIRMFNDHVVALFEQVKVGDRVAWVR
jgi:lipoprotein-anchoring transpeptidase ErfK/SrfK